MGSARMKEAIRIMERRQVQMAQTGEILEFGFVCAVFDKEFTQRFKRSPAGIWVFDRNITVQSGSAATKVTRADPTKVSLEQMDFGEYACLFCGDYGSTACDHCNTLVCNGRSANYSFTCRKSCGAAFQTRPAESMAGSLQKMDRWFRPSVSGHREAAIQPARKSFGFLGSGKR